MTSSETPSEPFRTPAARRRCSAARIVEISALCVRTMSSASRVTNVLEPRRWAIFAISTADSWWGVISATKARSAGLPDVAGRVSPEPLSLPEPAKSRTAPAASAGETISNPLTPPATVAASWRVRTAMRERHGAIGLERVRAC